ncbi:hypothetical protein CCHR01_11677 [Colletotrichum chrysophilum]|uniref:Uncharacterized protein n=1 Tax=Colletotrichum chrysophilum TaxID=1836956 RepID=A0AAD9EEV9_9PEZI|nr:hypothetical protein CCHR01_11677 [Colletotrichum chrysophilum]
MEIWLNPWSEDGLLRTAECPFAQSVALLMLPRLQPVPERQRRSDEQHVLKPAAPPDSADGRTQDSGWCGVECVLRAETGMLCMRWRHSDTSYRRLLGISFARFYRAENTHAREIESLTASRTSHVYSLSLLPSQLQLASLHRQQAGRVRAKHRVLQTPTGTDGADRQTQADFVCTFRAGGKALAS